MTIPATQMTEQRIALIRRTVAADLFPEEFDLFISMCQGWGLDPTRRQIYANVYSKTDPKKRRVVFVTGIDGYRAIADRTGHYRPGERSVVVRDELKDPKLNPYGIESASAEVWKHSQGEWHRFTETAYWDEFAPIKTWDGATYLDTKTQWPKMGRVMLMKCAEAQAIRRGWPDSVSGLYVEEEMHQADAIDITPSEVVERAGIKAREERLGGPALIVDWLQDGVELERVKVPDFFGRVMDYIKAHEKSPEKIVAWGKRNNPALKEYWVAKPEEALNLKKAFEDATAKLPPPEPKKGKAA